MTVEVLEPHGFCSGVKAAVERALHALSMPGPVYCLHELVHNEAVIAGLKAQGMRFVDDIRAVPCGAQVMFSAHGVSPATRAIAASRALRVVDATCPFVWRAHRQVHDYVARGLFVVVVGHADHVEVGGVWGEVVAAGGRGAIVGAAADVAELPPVAAAGIVSQTTLAGETIQAVVAALRARGVAVETPAAADVCTATKDRQEAVRRFVRAGGDGVLVLGSAHSSNTRRLAEIARAEGARAWQAGRVEDVAACDFSSVCRLGVTAGASTPEKFLRRVLGMLY
ncbi:MAG: 4-hydroxy-3-methylbut-2-enyl diphosphate reductase [Kiritimatiellia bacterium]